MSAAGRYPYQAIITSAVFSAAMEAGALIAAGTIDTATEAQLDRIADQIITGSILTADEALAHIVSGAVPVFTMQLLACAVLGYLLYIEAVDLDPEPVTDRPYDWDKDGL